MNIRAHQLVWIALLTFTASGCILVRTTEHRIRLNDDGSGEALLRLIDLRSDELSDSLVRRDYKQLMLAADKYGVEEFERPGRKITGKQFFVHGDTLILEISYTFQKIEAVEGLHASKDGLFMTVEDGREIVKTNGKVEEWRQNGRRIRWDSDAKRLMYIIREKSLPSTTSLAPLYARAGH